MSRSYKKTPWCGDRKTSGKRLANKTVRNGKYGNNTDIPSGSWYKKLYCKYSICDYGWVTTWEEYKRNYYYPKWPWSRRGEMPEKELYRKWLKYYRTK